MRQDTDGVLQKIRGTASKHARHAIDSASIRFESPVISADPGSALKKYSITLEESSDRKLELCMKRHEREISLLQELINDEVDPDLLHEYQQQLKAARTKLLNRIRSVGEYNIYHIVITLSINNRF